MKSVLCTVGLLHGDMAQDERNKVITEFKRRAVPILVATDVAGKFIANGGFQDLHSIGIA